MDKLEEIKKLKKLLDDGIIDDDDFKNKKNELLGLKKECLDKTERINKNQNNKIKSLDEYERELLEQVENEKQNDDVKSYNDDFYQKEKLKIKAKLEAEEEVKAKRKAETKAAIDRGTQKTKRFLKWILAVFLWLAGIGSFGTCLESGLVYIPLGIIFLLQGCMACPKITDITHKYEKYTSHKTIIVWITVIIIIILVSIFPPKDTEKAANNISNENINIQTNNN